MSEEIKVPEEVQNLNLLQQKLAAFRRVVSEASFAGKESQIVADLISHLKEEYAQVHEQFNNHPFVKKVMEDRAKQQAEDEKLAAELEAEMKQKMEIN